MQQYPGNRVTRSAQDRRTQPALPAVTAPTVPITIDSNQYGAPQQPSSKKRPHHARRAVLQLLGLALLLEAFSLALYPLLASATLKNDTVKHSLFAVFPWVPHLYWTTAFPTVSQALTRIPLFNPSTFAGSVNLLLLLLGLTFFLSLVASQVGRRVIREHLSRLDVHVIFWTVILLTVIFGLTYICAPGVLSQDVFLYGLTGRMVVVYHVNPYVTPLTFFPTDPLYAVLSKGPRETMLSGPVWLDLSIPVVIFARDSTANVLVGFRLLGLLAHLANALLIWAILAKLKPEARISGTILYAWNPVVLLLGVTEMHQGIVIVFLILLAVFFIQRRSFMLGWVFVLLATLINALCLLLLPLLLRYFVKELRTLRPFYRFLWWVAAIGISGLVVVLAYAPYWQGWAIAGISTSLRQTFIQDTAINSLDAALLHLPMTLPPPVSWLTMPPHWTILTAVTAGAILLLGLWLADTLELVLLFSSWLALALLLLLPTYWPWYIFLPLVLAICTASPRTIMLALLLTAGAALGYYFWLWQPAWPSQGLATLGLPLLIWGWVLFFTSTWQMAHVPEEEPLVREAKGLGLSPPSRPSWPGRASWPSRLRRQKSGLDE